MSISQITSILFLYQCVTNYDKIKLIYSGLSISYGVVKCLYPTHKESSKKETIVTQINSLNKIEDDYEFI